MIVLWFDISNAESTQDNTEKNEAIKKNEIKKKDDKEKLNKKIEQSNLK